MSQYYETDVIIKGLVKGHEESYQEISFESGDQAENGAMKMQVYPLQLSPQTLRIQKQQDALAIKDVLWWNKW